MSRCFRALCVMAIAIAMLQPLRFTSASQADPETGNQVNVEIIVDASGSMAGETDTGDIRMDSARRVLEQVIDSLPESGNVNVGLRIYGHEGDNTDAGRAESCASSELVVPVDGVDSQALLDQVDQLQPVGWTPLGFSLEEAANDFPDDTADNVSNSVILLTDGLETCDGDPAGAASSLLTSDLAITTYVIGFGTNAEEQAVLEEIAEQGGGQLFGAANTGQLMSALFEVLEELEVIEAGGNGESRDSPIGRGRAGTVGDYSVTVIDYTADATDLVLEENSFNDPPQDDYQFSIARVSVTYNGDSSGDPAFELNFQSVGNAAVGYSTFDPGCGVYPDDQYSAGELFNGGTSEFNACWQIESDDADSLVMYIENSLSFDDDPVWFSLGNQIAMDREPADDETEEEDAVATPERSTEDAELVEESSRDNPIPVGDTGIVGDFEITVLDVTPDATDLVMAENQFNNPPEDGFQFYIVNVSVTSAGEESIDPGFDLNFQSVGDSAVGYTTFDPGCGVYPDDQYSAGELFPGGITEFNVCWQIEGVDADSLVMYVEDSLDFDSDPVWFALND